MTSTIDSDYAILHSYRLANKTEKLNEELWRNNISNIPLKPKEFIPEWLRFRKTENYDRMLYCLGFWKVYESIYIERCSNEKTSFNTENRKIREN